MKDLNSIVSGLSKSGVLSSFASGAAGGALTSVLMGKKSKKAGKKALKVGALAAVGGLAWKAYKQYSDNKSSQPVSQANTQAIPPQPQHQAFDYSTRQIAPEQFETVVADDTSECGQMLLVRAMIAAAHADGHIDGDEQQRIFGKVDEMDLSVADKASLFDELRNPLSMDQIVTKTPNSETAIEVYAASLMAIDMAAPASQVYLNQLGDRLFIPTELRQGLQQQMQAHT